jgi:hypothetical protein
MSLEYADLLRPESWINAFEEGVKGIKKLGEVEEGDRTMIDSLGTNNHSLSIHQFIHSLTSSLFCQFNHILQVSLLVFF